MDGSSQIKSTRHWRDKTRTFAGTDKPASAASSAQAEAGAKANMIAKRQSSNFIVSSRFH
jgi:hypothetical protein